MTLNPEEQNLVNSLLRWWFDCAHTTNEKLGKKYGENFSQARLDELMNSLSPMVGTNTFDVIYGCWNRWGEREHWKDFHKRILWEFDRQRREPGRLGRELVFRRVPEMRAMLFIIELHERTYFYGEITKAEGVDRIVSSRKRTQGTGLRKLAARLSGRNG